MNQNKLTVMVSGLTLLFPSLYIWFMLSRIRWALVALSFAPLLAYAWMTVLNVYLSGEMSRSSVP